MTTKKQFLRMYLLQALLVLVYTVSIICDVQIRPHIILILADDVGWNDVGFHGSNQIPTPNIDALAYNGIILNRFYTQPSCTPSRAALLTGQYPIRFGYQGPPIIAGEDRNLPFNITALPQKLKDRGYATHLIGKWHLGAAYKKSTPLGHGFDKHFGYWNGYVGYFDHYNKGLDMVGFDMHDDFIPAWKTKGEYVTDLLTRKAEDVIWMHDKKKPLFLMVSHLAAHTGKNGFDLEVPDKLRNDREFVHINDKKRRLFAGMMSELDKSVGTLMQTLWKNGMLENAIVLFLSDNGAPTDGKHLLDNRGSNWPLRGQKLTVLEGGIRTPAIIYSSKFERKGVVSNSLIHISDLMPTLYAATGGNVKDLGRIDGINQWETLSKNMKTKRTALLVNIDEVNNSSALIGSKGRYKLVNGSTTYSEVDGGYHGEDGRNDPSLPYNTSLILDSLVNKAVGGNLTKRQILKVRNSNDIGNCRKSFKKYDPCRYNNFCLFDLLKDPCETTNLASEFPLIVNQLKRKLMKYWKQMQPQKKTFVDPRANPIYYNDSWHTWLEEPKQYSLVKRSLGLIEKSLTSFNEKII